MSPRSTPGGRRRGNRNENMVNSGGERQVAAELTNNRFGAASGPGKFCLVAQTLSGSLPPGVPLNRSDTAPFRPFAQGTANGRSPPSPAFAQSAAKASLER